MGEPRLSPDSQIASLKRDANLQKEIRELSKLAPHRQMAAIAFDWLIILGAAFLANRFFNPLTYTAAAIVIGSRQHALLAMMHEAAHARLFKNSKLNDAVSDLLAAYPTLMSTGWYRKHHLAHHMHTNTEQDPDWARKIHLPEWQFPMPAHEIRENLRRQLFVGGKEWLQLIAAISGRDWQKAIYWVIALAAFALFGRLSSLLLFWFVPLLTTFPLLQRFRSISEHFGLAHSHELNSSRDITAGAIERFVLAPHHVGLHLCHHMFPSVPQHNLPALRRALRGHAVFTEFAHENTSYFVGKNSVWSNLAESPIKET